MKYSLHNIEAVDVKLDLVVKITGTLRSCKKVGTSQFQVLCHHVFACFCFSSQHVNINSSLHRYISQHNSNLGSTKKNTIKKNKPKKKHLHTVP